MYRRAFTIVELVVVISVIAILSAITVVGIARYQADGRDAQRVANVTSIAEALEKYYDEHGEYPSCSSLTGSADTITGAGGALQGLSADALKAPQATAGTLNSIQCTDLLTNSSGDYFAYVGDGSSDCSGSSSCLQFVLKYRDEATGSIKTMTSRRQSPLNSLGAPVLTSSGITFNSVTPQWTATANTSQYRLQVDTVNSFNSSNLQVFTVSGLSQNVTSLAGGTTYYFRVAPYLNGNTGNWSNIVSPTTLQMATPTGLAVVSNSSTQLTASWNAVTTPVAATSYNLRYSTSSGMSSPTTITGVTGTSRAVTSLTTGTTYYFQVQALNGANPSAWSSTASGVPAVPVPSCISLSGTTTTGTTVNWCDVSGASYVIEYSTASNFSSVNCSTPTGCTTSASGTTSKAITGLQQGTRYYFRVKAVINSVNSEPTSSANIITTLSAPSINSWYTSFGCCYSGYTLWPGDGYYSGWYISATLNATCPVGSSLSGTLYSEFGAYPRGGWTGYPGSASISGTGGTWYQTNDPYYNEGVYFWGTVYCSAPNATSSAGLWEIYNGGDGG